MLLGDLGEYAAKVNRARRDHPDLAIKLALEVDYLPGHEEWIRELAGRHPTRDYLIGAVHYLSDSWELDNPKTISEWKNTPRAGSLHHGQPGRAGGGVTTQDTRTNSER